MSARSRHHDLATDSTALSDRKWAGDERLRTALLVGVYGLAHALALLGAVSMAVTLAGILPGGPVALAVTLFGGLGLVAAAPAAVRWAFETALDARTGSR